jgi:HKD family nuclease
LEAAIGRADRIRLIVAFVMESGVKLILPSLQQAASRGVSIELIAWR